MLGDCLKVQRLAAEDVWKKCSSLAEQTSKVRVRLVGVLGSAAERREMDLEWSDSLTVSKLVENLLRAVGNHRFEELLVDSGTRDPRPNVIILIDEQDCNLFGGVKTLLEKESIVTIIPVAHGG